jgi:hypothetical protein
VSIITLIHKPGKFIHKVESYRQISLLQSLFKLFEKMLSKRLHTILNETMTIPNHQFGFWKRRSATEHLYSITQNISQELEKKKYCSAVFLDDERAR